MFEADKEISITGKLIRIARIKDEWYEDIEDPVTLIEKLKESKINADIFTFWQRLPDKSPIYNYYIEWDSIAALPVSSFDYWFTKQIDAKIRNLIRKAQKKGVEIRETTFDDEFVKGITSIFNETPIRQGKPFWHYGMDFDTVKKVFSQNIHREDIIGAYYNDNLIGFIMLAHAGKYAMLTQILSKIEHRDKSPQNALIAKAVEVCEAKKIPYLVYAMWPRGTLADFKRNNAFEKVDLPRYYIPLTMKGMIALKFHLHHDIAELLPDKVKDYLKDVRSKWYSRKYKSKA